MKYKISNYKYKIIFCILIILALTFYILRISTIFDENYSLILIHNNIFNIIKLDSLDVHPPLFYFSLKLFLLLTTFWTKSIIIKIIFSRIFAFIISLITFIILRNILKLCNIRMKLLSQFLIFLIIPGVVSFTYELIKIRMYSLAGLFVSLQLYNLVKYSKDSNNINLIGLTISTILSMYTNYYSGMISGLIILIYMINFIKQHKKWYKLFIVGLISLVSYIPWLPILLNQISLQSYHPIGGFYKQWIATFCVICVFFYPVIWSYKYLKGTNLIFLITFSNVFIVTLLVLIIMSLCSILFKPIFEFRYFYPILVIYGFFSLNICIKMLNQKSNMIKHFIPFVIILLNTLVCIISYTNQLKYYNSSSIQIYRNISQWRHSKHSIIYLRPNYNQDQGFDMEKVIYLSSQDKYVYIPKNDRSLKYPNNIELTRTNPSYKKLFSKVNKHIVN